jgi:tRNA G26 N,N-dimethylase Trm1
MKSGLIIEVTFGGSGLIRGVIVFIMMAMLSKVQLNAISQKSVRVMVLNSTFNNISVICQYQNLLHN